MADDTVKFLLSESDIPSHWVNLLSELPGEPLPPLNPQTLEPAGPPDLTPIFPMGLIEQEVSPEPEIAIPEPVLDAYRLWRPTPLFRARRLERELDTPAHIYYKYEGVSPAGSHKPNTAVPQAYENSQAGISRLSTETGAGQWGSALAFACTLFDLECEVFMVGSSYDQKPYRRSMMQTWGASVHRSPSTLTEARAAHSSPTPPDRSASPSPRRSRWPPSARTPTTRSARCSITSCCIRRSSARRRSREHVDVLIVGAGLSGIGAGYHLQASCPG
jgi:tryptophan synthase beta chain